MAKALDDPFPEDISLLAGPESSSDEDDWHPCYFLESTLWEAAIGKFVLGDSMHSIFGRREDLSINQIPLTAEDAAAALAKQEEEWRMWLSEPFDFVG